MNKSLRSEYKWVRMLRAASRSSLTLRCYSTTPQEVNLLDVDALLKRVQSLKPMKKTPGRSQQKTEKRANGQSRDANTQRQTKSNEQNRARYGDKARTGVAEGANLSSNVSKRTSKVNVESVAAFTDAVSAFDTAPIQQRAQGNISQGNKRRSSGNVKAQPQGGASVGTGFFRGSNNGSNSFRGPSQRGPQRNSQRGPQRGNRRAPGINARNGRNTNRSGEKRTIKTSPVNPNIALQSTEYKPEQPTSADLLQYSPFTSTSYSSRLLNAYFSKIQNPNTNLAAIFRGSYGQLNAKDYDSALKTEGLRHNSRIVINALNRTPYLDDSFKAKLLKPLIGLGTVKSLSEIKRLH